MKLCILALLFFIPFSARAAEIYTDEPKCAVIRNESIKSAVVSIRTDFYTKENGARSYYEEILRMKPKDVRQVCAKGPFLPDYKVYLVIKSFVPLFDCKTKLEGEIPIRDKPTQNGEGTIPYAVCVD